MKALLLIVILFTSTCSAQTVFLADTGEITFYSYAIVEDIKSTCNQVNSIFNSVTGEIAFMIPIRSFHFEKSLMQEHFNEKYMESDKYPHATFKGKIREKIDVSKPGKYGITAKGKLSIHGKEKEVTESGEIVITENQIIINSQFFAALEDFDIKKPQILFNNIADTIQVKIKAWYKPYKKD